MGFRSRPVAFGQQTPLLSILSHTRISVEVRGSRPVALIWRPDGSTTLGLGERLPCDPGARVRGNRPRVQGEKVVAAGGSFAGPCLGLASRTSFKACCPGRRLAYSPFGTAPPAPDSRRGSTLRRSQRNEPPKSRVRGRLRSVSGTQTAMETETDLPPGQRSSRPRHMSKPAVRRFSLAWHKEKEPPMVRGRGRFRRPDSHSSAAMADTPTSDLPCLETFGRSPLRVGGHKPQRKSGAAPPIHSSCSQSMLRQDINLSDVTFRLNPLGVKPDQRTRQTRPGR